MEYLGRYSIYKDAVLPIIASENSIYEYIDEGEYNGYRLKVTKNQPIVLPKSILEQGLIEFKLRRIKTRSRPYLRYKEQITFGLVGEKEQVQGLITPSKEHQKTILFDTQIDGYIIEINRQDTELNCTNLFVMRWINPFYIPLTIEQDYQLIPTQDKLIIVLGWHLKGKVLLTE